MPIGERATIRRPSPTLPRPSKPSRIRAPPYLSRGTAYAEKGDLDKAIADFGEAIQNDPTLAAAYYRRADALQKKGKPDAALADLNTAIRRDPMYAEAYQSRGRLYQQKGDKANAEKDFLQAKKLGVSAKAVANSPEAVKPPNAGKTDCTQASTTEQSGEVMPLSGRSARTDYVTGDFRRLREGK